MPINQLQTTTISMPRRPSRHTPCSTDRRCCIIKAKIQKNSRRSQRPTKVGEVPCNFIWPLASGRRMGGDTLSGKKVKAAPCVGTLWCFINICLPTKSKKITPARRIWRRQIMPILVTGHNPPSLIGWQESPISAWISGLIPISKIMD